MKVRCSRFACVAHQCNVFASCHLLTGLDKGFLNMCITCLVAISVVYKHVVAISVAARNHFFHHSVACAVDLGAHGCAEVSAAVHFLNLVKWVGTMSEMRGNSVDINVFYRHDCRDAAQHFRFSGSHIVNLVERLRLNQHLAFKHVEFLGCFLNYLGVVIAFKSKITV